MIGLKPYTIAELEIYPRLELLNKILQKRAKKKTLGDYLTKEEVKELTIMIPEIKNSNTKHKEIEAMNSENTNYLFFFGGGCDCNQCEILEKAQTLSNYLTGIKETIKHEIKAIKLIPEWIKIDRKYFKPEIKLTEEEEERIMKETIQLLEQGNNYEKIAKKIIEMDCGYKTDDLLITGYTITAGSRKTENINLEKLTDWAKEKLKNKKGIETMNLKEMIEKDLITKKEAKLPTKKLITIINNANYERLKDNNERIIINEDKYQNLKQALKKNEIIIIEEELEKMISYEQMIKHLEEELEQNKLGLIVIPAKEYLIKKMNKLDINVESLKAQKTIIQQRIKQGRINTETAIKSILTSWAGI